MKLTAREDGADFPLFEAKNCKYIELDNVTVEGFSDPYIITDNADKVKMIGGTNVRIN